MLNDRQQNDVPFFDFDTGSSMNDSGSYDMNWNSQKPSLPMKWYKALLVLLPLGALGNIVMGILYMTGLMVKSVGYNGIIYRSTAGVDVFYGLLLFAAAAAAIIAAIKLKDYKSDGPTWVYLVYAVNYGLGILYEILASIALNAVMVNMVSIVMLPAMGAVVIFLNIKYFDRRAHLFVK